MRNAPRGKANVANWDGREPYDRREPYDGREQYNGREQFKEEKAKRSKRRISRRVMLGAAGVVAAAGTGAVLLHNNSSIEMPFVHNGASTRPYNLRDDFGAAGDGKSDDTHAFTAATEKLAAAGKGALYIPAGTYLITNSSLQKNVHNSSYVAGFFVPGNTRVFGDGPGLSIIKFDAKIRDQATMLMNLSIGRGGDENIVLENLGFDGSAAHQAAHGVDCHYGAGFMKVRGLRVFQCDFYDFYGIGRGENGPYGTPGEGFCTSVSLSSDVEYINSRCYATSRATATGFSANSSNNIRYIGCWADNFGIGQGFTHNNCAHVKHTSCHSYRNAVYGFNSELSSDVLYSGCTAGGLTINNGTWPFAAHTSLGNGVAGFTITKSTRVWVTDCEGVSNGKYGLWAATDSGPIIISGGDYSNNKQYGLSLSYPTQIRIVARPNFSGNGVTPIRNRSYNVDPTTILPPPPVPLSGETSINPFPFACSVIITGGTVSSIEMNGATTGLTATPASIRIPHGGTITLTYSAAPAWTWWTD